MGLAPRLADPIGWIGMRLCAIGTAGVPPSVGCAAFCGEFAVEK